MTMFCGWTLPTCIMNASGARCTSWEELKTIEESESSVIVSKSCTLLPREGNKGKRYWDNDIMSINSTGLANNGYSYYNLFNFNKPYIISVAGLTLEDNLTILGAMENRVVELNLSCPNIAGKGQVCYDMQMMDEYLRQIYERFDIQMGVKMSPYFDNFQFENAAEILNKYPLKFVTCINSLGNGYMIDNNQKAIEANDGFGGVGGRCILPFALSNVYKMRKLLSSGIDIVGCGGITTGEDVYKHLISGATVVQVGTQFVKEGPAVFSRLNQELSIFLG